MLGSYYGKATLNKFSIFIPSMVSLENHLASLIAKDIKRAWNNIYKMHWSFRVPGFVSQPAKQ